MTLSKAPAELEVFLPTLQHVADRWQHAGRLIPAFSLLANGQPLRVEDAAAAAATDVRSIDRALATARCRRDSEGRLIDLYGMSLIPTIHRLEIGGRVVFSCCALWAHTIPMLIRQSTVVESVDPIGKQIVRLELTPDGLASTLLEPSAATLAIASREAIETDVASAFCDRVNHFRSAGQAEEFAARRGACRPVSVATLSQAAGFLVRAIYHGSGCRAS